MTEIILLRTIKATHDHGLFRNTIWPVVEEPTRPNQHVQWWIVTDAGKEFGIKADEAKEVR